MDWRSFQHAQLFRLFVQLTLHESYYLGVVAFLKKYNFPPNDPLRIEAERSLRQTRDFISEVRPMVAALAPRPQLVNPWKLIGLDENLKPDLPAGGKTEPES